jgi:hypothetical protein
MKNRNYARSRPYALKAAATARKPRLDPYVQARIGQQLGKIYDDIVKQGVPERFRALVEQLDLPVKSNGNPQ